MKRPWPSSRRLLLRAVVRFLAYFYFRELGAWARRRGWRLPNRWDRNPSATWVMYWLSCGLHEWCRRRWPEDAHTLEPPLGPRYYFPDDGAGRYVLD